MATVTTIDKVGGLAGFQFTMFEYSTAGWLNLAMATDTLIIPESVMAINIAPDSDMDQALVVYPNFLLGPTGTPPQQSMRVGVGAPIIGRLDAQGVSNGEVGVSPGGPGYVITGAAFETYFSAALASPEFPKLKVQLWWQNPPATLPTSRAIKNLDSAIVTLPDGLENPVYRLGAWGRKHVYFFAAGTNAVVFNLYGVSIIAGSASVQKILLGTATMASGVAQIGPIDNKPFDIIEVTATGALGNSFRPRIWMAD
jgi:hypothetical protein